MKLSNEWVHQPEVDEAADAILAEGKVTLATITACQVAKSLDRSANPSMYGKFRNWRARRQAEADPVTVDVPPEVEASIRAIFARLTDDGVGACLDAVRVVGGSLDRVAMLRIGDAERRADKAGAETAEVVAIGEKIEAELRAATIRIAELEQAVADAQRREDRLAGRLELRESDLAAALQSRTAAASAEADVHGGGDSSDGVRGDASNDCEGAINNGEAGGSVPPSRTDPIPVAQLRLTFAGFGVDDGGGSDAH